MLILMKKYVKVTEKFFKFYMLQKIKYIYNSKFSKK